MRIPFYDIKAQHQELAEELNAAALEVLANGAYVMGPNHKAFEQEVAELHGVKHAIAVNSGTDALRIAMDAVGIGPGDEVITTAFTFVASVETIVQTGATPVFVDIDPRTFCMDPAKVAAAINPRTKAILPIHLFGQLAEIEPIVELACANELLVLEDAAQAFMTRRNGKFAGQFGIAAGYSFYVTKNIGAAGDGGMIVTNDDETAENCRSIRVHGMGRERYYYDHIGYTSRLDELKCALLRIKLRYLAEWNARRSKIASIYLDRLADTDLVLPLTSEGNEHTWHQFSVLSDRRNELQSFLKEREIDSMIYYPVPIHYHAPYQEFGAGEGSLPVTEDVSRRILNLPIHPHLTEEAAHHVADSILAFVGEKVAS
ncbi:MAG: DegT/DnrJ/EryC1/StrS family aminotransferase [Fimbriimonas sp.]